MKKKWVILLLVLGVVAAVVFIYTNKKPSVPGKESLTDIFDYNIHIRPLLAAVFFIYTKKKQYVPGNESLPDIVYLIFISVPCFPIVVLNVMVQMRIRERHNSGLTLPTAHMRF